MKKNYKKLTAAVLILILFIPVAGFADTVLDAGDKSSSASAMSQASEKSDSSRAAKAEEKERESKDAPSLYAPKVAENKEGDQAKFAKNILTYDFVLDKAIAENPQLESYRFKKEQVDEQINATAERFFDLVPPANAGIEQAQAALNQVVANSQVLQTQSEVYEESKKYTVESLKTAIRQIFYSIESNEAAIALQKQKLDFLNKIDKINDLRLSLGLVSSYDAQKAKDDLNLELQNLKEMEAKLQNDMLDLNKYVQVQDISKYTIESIQVKYDLLEQSTEQVDTRAAQASYLDVAVFSKRQSLKVKEVMLDQRIYTTTKAIDQAEYRVEQSDLSTLQKQTKDGIIDLYQKMNLLGQSIVTQEMELVNQEKELAHIQLLLSKGNAAPLDVDKMILTVEGTKLSIQEKKKQYESLKLLYQNPYIGASFSGGISSQAH